MHHYAITDPSGALRIVLPLPTPSANEWSGKHWSKRYKLKANWSKAIAAVVRVAEHRTMTPMRVTIERHMAGPGLDPDNLVAGVKPILDAMVTLGLLVDDSARWLELHVSQHKTGKGEPAYTSIVIEEAAGIATVVRGGGGQYPSMDLGRSARKTKARPV